MDYSIVLPSKPRIVSEEGSAGVYEIDGFYPGFGHTIGNSLRRIILSSIPGAAITSVKIDGVSHEFSTMAGVKEDVVAIILNLKKVRIRIADGQPHTITLSVKGQRAVTAGDIEVPGQVEILNPTQHIAELTDKNAKIDMELTVDTGLGYVPKEVLQKERAEIGAIVLDAIFTPIRRAHYEVENMRVGDKTNFNRLRVSIETDGTLTPREALERSITVMIQQLKAIVGFKEDEPVIQDEMPMMDANQEDVMKTRVDDMELSTRTANALTQASIRTVGGLVRKTDTDLLSIEGVGQKAVDEIKDALKRFGLTLKKAE
ncbi:MAG: DNA-directed RNA polymerase subunit alpha [Candidatus Pacebacteria bacterium]|jgi:DNA-directed RNA polymerase subunit alpha|nr:DNA-directed RNA polymerase subunit alpha [Candidatus Paceibacterota bacterium]